MWARVNKHSHMNRTERNCKYACSENAHELNNRMTLCHHKRHYMQSHAKLISKYVLKEVAFVYFWVNFSISLSWHLKYFVFCADIRCAAEP